MNVLFLSLIDFESFSDRNIYSDLLREFIKNGHNVFSISPVERRIGRETYMIQEGSSCILRLKIGNIQKVNSIEKGISTILIEPLFINGIKKYFSNVRFDLVLYATPPITFAKVIKFIKKRDRAKSYLMLKDIFPQNSLDLGMLSAFGIKGLIYRYFRRKEKALYFLSDTIGCMSRANCNYILRHNPEVESDKVEICPNSIEPLDLRVSDEDKNRLREMYRLPLDKKIFVYGGNLGRPQDVPFIINCLKACSNIKTAYFVIAGSGTDRHYLEEYIESEKPQHVKLFGFFPKEEYDSMIACCDIGLVFLDHRFTIPNFPSRLLAYMQAGLPVLCCTDKNTDVGKVVVNGRFGWWCPSDDKRQFVSTVKEAVNKKDYRQMGYYGFLYLKNNFAADLTYKMIKHRGEN